MAKGLVDLKREDIQSTAGYGIPCLYTMPRGGDHQKGVQFKRKFEPFWIARYYKKGGRLYE